MNISKNLVLGLLEKDEISFEDRLQLLAAHGVQIQEPHKAVYDFIIKHYSEYKVCPAKETVTAAFPSYDIDYGKEPYIFYLEKAEEHKKIKQLQTTMEAIESKIAEGKINEALSQLSLSARSFEMSDVRSKDVSVKGDIDTTLEEYKYTRDHGVTHGLYTGLSRIDDATNGIMPAEFWVLAGRPGSNKTWMMCYLFAQIGLHNEGNIIFFSKEMSKVQIQARVNAILGSVSFSDLRRYKLTDEQIEQVREGVNKLVANLIIIGRDSSAAYDISFVQSKIVEYQPKLAIIDGLYLFSKSTDWGDQTNATRSIRQIALDTNCPIIGTTQQNRAKGKKDQDSIAYSDSFLQDASVLITMEKVWDEVSEKYLPTLKMCLNKVRDDQDQQILYVTPNFKNSTFEQGSVPSGDAADLLVEAGVGSITI